MGIGNIFIIWTFGNNIKNKRIIQMKKILSLFSRMFIGIYVVYLVSSVFAYFYIYWSGENSVPGQIYYMNNINMNTFRLKYEKLCSSESVPKHYISPYHGNEKNIRFIREKHETGMGCEFYSKKGHVLMLFDIKDKSPLEVFYYGIELSRSTEENISDYRRNINDGRELARDCYYMTLFENEVLKNIDSFKRNNWQGYVCWYANFFYQHLLHILAIGSILCITKFFHP